MSSSLVLGLLLGLAVGGPLYYTYLAFTKKRKHEALKGREEMKRGEQTAGNGQVEKKDQEMPEDRETQEGQET